MSRAPRQLSESGFYHVVVRGNGKRIIFEQASDYSFYLDKLRRLCNESRIEIIAFCLMSNHVHLVLSDLDGNISTVMKRLNIAYAIRFNRSNDSVGHVFQDRFFSRAIISDEELVMAVRYVHANPQKAGICRMSDYPWSSYGEYASNRKYCDTQTFLDLVGGRDAFASVMNSFDDGYDDFGALLAEANRVNDDKALSRAKSVLSPEEWTKMVSSDSKRARNEALRKLKTCGISIRQAQRLTGLGRSVIARAYQGA